MTIYDYRDCTCGPYWSIVPPGPCPVHTPNAPCCACHCHHVPAASTVTVKTTSSSLSEAQIAELVRKYLGRGEA